MDMSAIIQPALVPSELGSVDLRPILRAVRTHLGMDVGFVSEFANGRRVFRHVESAEGKACIEVGASDPLKDSYCYWIAEGKLAQIICDPNDHAISAAMAVTKALPVGAHLSVPIKLRDGHTYGTFCCFSHVTDHSLTERDLATMEAFAQVAACQIQDEIDAGKARATKVARIERILKHRDLSMVFQPAFNMTSGEIDFLEALARIYTRPQLSPDQWFKMASETGLAVDLELLALREALGALGRLPHGVSLSLNASPDFILSDAFVECMQTAPLRRLIVEITEHEMVSHYALLNNALAPFRQKGLRVAVDDMGAGYSSLRHILQIRPDIIKLDISLVRDIDSDPVRRALASALVIFSRDIGSRIVAEGVETQAELETLRELGADMVQGFLLGTPQPLVEARTSLKALDS